MLICQKSGKFSNGHRTGKVVFIPIPKSVQTTVQLCSFHMKILQVRLQQYMNWEIPDIQAGFRKCRGPRGQIANIH